MSDKSAREPLRDLDDRLQSFKAEVKPKSGPDVPRPMGPGVAFEIAGHLVAGLLLGGTIGYFLDQWLDTAPVLLVVFFLMGAGAGMVNVYRTVAGLGMAAGYRPASNGRNPGSPDSGGGRGDKGAKTSEDEVG